MAGSPTRYTACWSPRGVSIVSRLKHTAISIAPTYEALSRTWGDSSIIIEPAISQHHTWHTWEDFITALEFLLMSDQPCVVRNAIHANPRHTTQIHLLESRQLIRLVKDLYRKAHAVLLRLSRPRTDIFPLQPTLFSAGTGYHDKILME